MTDPLAGFLALREPAEPGATRGLAARLTERLDEGIRGLAEPLDASTTALVATGGYGAGWMCVHSDVDIMVLHRGRADAAAVRRFLHPLWDAGLRVGHAVRTPREARTAARDRLDTLTSLVTSRLLWGDTEVFDDLEATLGKLLARRWDHVTREWLAEETARRDAEPYRLMASNLKSGRSGLRSLQLLTWFDAAARLTGRDVPERHADAATTRETLLAARNALHLVAGRRHETIDLELRAPVASALGTTVPDLLATMLRTRERVEQLIDDRWGGRIEPGPGPRPIASPAPPDPVMAAAGAALREGRRFTDDEAALIAGAAPPHWTAPDRALLVALVSDPWGRRLWRELARLGWMRRALPEWNHVVALPHVVPFHAHSVSEHLLRTTEAVALGRAARDLSDDDEALLTLAALVHDVGKGRHGDHSQIGGALAEGLGMRMQLPHRDSADLGALVKNHLLLPDLATRFDLDDPEVVEAAVDQVGSPRVLELLLHLTEADSKATGSDTWTPWKQSLLERAHRVLQSAFAAADADLSFDRAHVAALTTAPSVRVDAHLEMVPVGYLRAVPPALIARHVELLDPPLVTGEIRLTTAADVTTTHVAVAASDRTGLVADLAGVFALENISVIDARCYTRADGAAVDVFEVVDVLTGKPVPETRFAAVRGHLDALASGKLDLEPAVSRKRADYRSAERPGVETSVSIRRQPGSWVVEVATADRPGLLYSLSHVLSHHGLDITRARIDTRGGEAVDAFHTPTEPPDRAALEADLVRAAREA